MIISGQFKKVGNNLTPLWDKNAASFIGGAIFHELLEHFPNEPLFTVDSELKAFGTRCYLADNLSFEAITYAINTSLTAERVFGGKEMTKPPRELKDLIQESHYDDKYNENYEDMLAWILIGYLQAKERYYNYDINQINILKTKLLKINLDSVKDGQIEVVIDLNNYSFEVKEIA